MVFARVTAVADFDNKRSYVKHVDTQITARPGVGKDWKDDSGFLTPEGFKAQTHGFVQGLIANIHAADQKGGWDSAEHIRYIIENLERGFAQASVTISESEM